MKKFLIVVDTQKDFMEKSGALYVDGADKLIDPLQDFIEDLNPDLYCGVLFTFDTHFEDTYAESEEAKQFPPHCLVETEGWKNVVDLKSVPHGIKCFELDKGVFNMWAEEGVEIYWNNEVEVALRDDFFNIMKALGIDTIEVVGVCSDVCVKDAINGLVEQGFKVEVRRDLVRGINQQIDEVVREMSQPNFDVSII